MRRLYLICGVIGLVVAAASYAATPYKVSKIAKVGGMGGFDYLFADVAGRRLYVPRSGKDPAPRISVFDLDTLKSVGEIANFSAHGAAVDSESHHGFATSKPVVMWDTKSLKTIKTIDVEGNPDGILFDAFNQHVYILSHAAPNITVIAAKDGTVVGTIDLGGAPEQAVTDGHGHIYVDIEDKNKVAVVDAQTMAVTARYDLDGKGGTPAGLAFDVKNHILFVACRNPATMVMLNAENGKIIDTLPIGNGTDGAVFNPRTMEAFSSQGDGTLTVIRENSPTRFTVEQNVQTPLTAKTLTLDSKTNRVILISAEFGPSSPPAQPGGRAVRGPMVPDSFSVVAVSK